MHTHALGAAQEVRHLHHENIVDVGVQGRSRERAVDRNHRSPIAIGIHELCREREVVLYDGSRDTAPGESRH